MSSADSGSAAVPARQRPQWPGLPVEIRAGVESRLGERVERWESCDGGYSAGLASVLWTAHDRVFVKAAHQDYPDSQRLYRQEAERTACLPDSVPAPQLRWVADLASPQGNWVALAFDAVEGRPPRQPWNEEELDAVARLVEAIGGHTIAAGRLPDAGVEYPHGHWERLADQRPAGLAAFDPWVAASLDRLPAIEGDLSAALAGSHLGHGDLRGDNMVMTGGPAGPRAVAVDWPFALRGARFCDFVGMLPAIDLEGGPDPATMLARYPHLGGPPDAVTSFLAALTGYFVDMSLRPPPTGIPHVRAFQRVQAEVCITWLRQRLA